MHLVRWFAEEYDPEITLTQVCEVSCMHMYVCLTYEQGNIATNIYLSIYLRCFIDHEDLHQAQTIYQLMEAFKAETAQVNL